MNTGRAVQGLGAVVALGDVVLVDVELRPQRALAERHMGLDVHRVHVLVFRVGEGQAQDRFAAVAVGVVAAGVGVGFDGLECGHFVVVLYQRSTTRRLQLARETHGMNLRLLSLSSSLSQSSRWSSSPSTSSTSVSQ
ncbi:hypothetical protein D3C80_1583770 [compost metagenome]